MGVELHDLRVMLRVLGERGPGRSLLFLGDPVLHFDSAELQKAAAEAGVSVSAPEPMDGIGLGRALGFERVETGDVAPGATLKLDLHEPPPEELVGAFDWVVDAGTIFWCSDPGAALRTMRRMIRPGGVAIHITAVSGHYGHGYYNLHPKLLEDFHAANEGRLLHAVYRPKYRPAGLAGRLMTLLRLPNRVYETSQPGNVYLARAGARRIEFGRSLRADEPNLVPNKVVGTMAFECGEVTQIRMPILSGEPGAD
jgi:SAM-dependent methyltransferase